MRLSLVVFVLAATALAACDSNTNLPTSCPDTGLVTIADSVVGTGQPASGVVTVDYIGRLVAAPDTFFDRGFSVRFDLNNPDQTRRPILGFQQGIRGRAATDDAPAISAMRPGGIRRIFIPANFGYGPRDLGVIPPCSDLIFDVTLRDV